MQLSIQILFTKKILKINNHDDDDDDDDNNK